MIIVVMGVAGCGKSTVGKLLAQRLSLPFIEADAYHSQTSVAKMAGGIPLTDEDRQPWLEKLSELLQAAEKQAGAVLACSALKEKYRRTLQQNLQETITWILLDGPEDVISSRIKERSGHFMPEELLRSQFATMEKPAYAHVFSVTVDAPTIVNGIVKLVSGKTI